MQFSNRLKHAEERNFASVFSDLNLRDPFMTFKGIFSDGFAHDLVNSCLKLCLKEFGKIKQ